MLRSVYPNDCRIGIPQVVVSRAVLGARTPVEAIRHMLVRHRAAGYNHLLAHESGELYNVEVSARKFAILYGEDGYIVHTNNYLDYNMQAIEDRSEELIGTRARYFRALRLIKSTPRHTPSNPCRPSNGIISTTRTPSATTKNRMRILSTGKRRSTPW